MEAIKKEEKSNGFSVENKSIIENQSKAAIHLSVAAIYNKCGNYEMASQSNYIAQIYLDMADEAMLKM